MLPDMAAPLTFASPLALWGGAALVAAIIAITAVRRPDLPGFSKALAALGLPLLCLAAGGLTCHRPVPPPAPAPPPCRASGVPPRPAPAARAALRDARAPRPRPPPAGRGAGGRPPPRGREGRAPRRPAGLAQRNTSADASRT